MAQMDLPTASDIIGVMRQNQDLSHEINNLKAEQYALHQDMKDLQNIYASYYGVPGEIGDIGVPEHYIDPNVITQHIPVRPEEIGRIASDNQEMLRTIISILGSLTNNSNDAAKQVKEACLTIVQKMRQFLTAEMRHNLLSSGGDKYIRVNSVRDALDLIEETIIKGGKEKCQ